MLGVKNEEGHRRAETPCPHERYRVHPPMQVEQYFRINQYSEFHQDNMLLYIVQLGNSLMILAKMLMLNVC
jgi:hypothetical protein